MLKRIEVTFSPGEFSSLRDRKLEDTACVVFDVLRATSTMVTALAHGAAGVTPVESIAEALRLRQFDPDLLLAGERDGLRISAGLAGGMEFDLGNSPREFTPERVAGRSIATTTTNGTRALRACAHAPAVLAGSFLNLRATAEAVLRLGNQNLVIVCAGTLEEAAYEDTLGAGALCDALATDSAWSEVSDSAKMARLLFLQARADLLRAISTSRNGQRLGRHPELNGDVAFCAQLDCSPNAVVMDKSGCLRVST